MAREGHGVAWLPQTLALEDQERGRLVRAGPERFDIPIEIRLFRSLDTRNKMADELWGHLEPTNDGRSRLASVRTAPTREG